MLRTAAVLMIVGAILPAGRRADACDMSRILVEPTRQDTHVVGTVLRYGEVARPSAAIATAVSLVIRTTDIVSGRIEAGEVSIVPLDYGPDCSSFAAPRAHVEREYPLGVELAIYVPGGAPRGAAAGPRTLVVETRRGGYLARLPPGLKRTAQGDLAFDQYASAQLGALGWFEFDRAVLRLPEAPRAERFARLMNLAHFDYFPYMRNGPAIFDRLVEASGVTPPQRQQLLDAFRRR
jgi:hypothetical protein